MWSDAGTRSACETTTVVLARGSAVAAISQSTREARGPAQRSAPRCARPGRPGASAGEAWAAHLTHTVEWTVGADDDVAPGDRGVVPDGARGERRSSAFRTELRTTLKTWWPQQEGRGQCGCPHRAEQENRPETAGSPRRRGEGPSPMARQRGSSCPEARVRPKLKGGRRASRRHGERRTSEEHRRAPAARCRQGGRR